MMHCIKNVNIKMKLFENRILYSFYCFEQWIDGSFHMLFRGVKVWSMKKMYNLNPFGYIKKRNKSLDEYINNVYLAAIVACRFFTSNILLLKKCVQNIGTKLFKERWWLLPAPLHKQRRRV